MLGMIRISVYLFLLVYLVAWDDDNYNSNHISFGSVRANCVIWTRLLPNQLGAFSLFANFRLQFEKSIGFAVVDVALLLQIVGNDTNADTDTNTNATDTDSTSDTTSIGQLIQLIIIIITTIM